MPSLLTTSSDLRSPSVYQSVFLSVYWSALTSIPSKYGDSSRLSVSTCLSLVAGKPSPPLFYLLSHLPEKCKWEETGTEEWVPGLLYIVGSITGTLLRTALVLTHYYCLYQGRREPRQSWESVLTKLISSISWTGEVLGILLGPRWQSTYIIDETWAPARPSNSPAHFQLALHRNSLSHQLPRF